jgi:hypothetical protein
LEAKKIGDLLRGTVLLAIAVLMAVLLGKVYFFLDARGIAIKDVLFFPIALIGAICWLTYRGLKAVVSAFRDGA